MSSKKQTRHGEGTSGIGKSARKGEKSNHLLSNNECCCNANAKLDASKRELLSKQCKPSVSFWFMVKLFVARANREDLLWLDNMINDYENNVDGQMDDRPPNFDENNTDKILAKQLLKNKLSMSHREIETSVSSQAFQPVMRFVFYNEDGKQLIISRETLKSNLTNNHVKPITEPSCMAKKISYEFIARLIYWDDSLSHLRGISPKQINDYLHKCSEEGCLEKINIKIQNMDKKILSYKKRGNYSVKREEKTASMYRELKDIRLILEKYNKYVSERRHPYFMFH